MGCFSEDDRITLMEEQKPFIKIKNKKLRELQLTVTYVFEIMSTEESRYIYIYKNLLHPNIIEKKSINSTKLTKFSDY